MEDLEELKLKKAKLQLSQAGIGATGTVLGWIYANKTGGGFWRYIGFGIMSGIALGTVGYFTIAPKLVDIQFKINEKEKQL
tara:strand:+ start:7401 stop:7643 length:243 start_codon:yes stop_codon:yes gene_type:complete